MVMNVVMILALLAGALTLVSGLQNPSRVPLWIPLLLICVALLVLGAPRFL